MKRQLIEVCRNVNGLEFDKIFKLCKELYPRRKYEAYSLKKDKNGKTKYVLKYNLTNLEYITLRKIYENMNNTKEGNTYKKYEFTVEWEKGSINDNIIKYLKEKNISFHYNHFGTLVADLYGIGQYFKFEYEYINGNTYGITATENIL